MSREMKPDDLRKYNDVSDQMEGLAGYLGTCYFPESPIRQQLFLCRDLKAPLSEIEWAKLIVANVGKLPKELAAWEHWDRFPDGTGWSRYFGCGDKSVLDDFVEEILKVGYRLLVEYEELDLPSQLEWNLPNPVRCLRGCVLEDYHCFVDLLARGWTENVKGGPEVVGTEGLNLRVLYSDDSFWDTAEAIKEWVPTERISLPPMEQAEIANSSHIFRFNERNRRWYLRFPGDEDCECNELKGLTYYAKLLMNPGKPITSHEFCNSALKQECN